MNNQAQGYTAKDAAEIAKKIRDYEQLVNIAWLVLGILQCLSMAGIICGVWNIYASVQGLKNKDYITPHNPNVVSMYQNGMTNMIISLLMNIFLGGFVGVALVVCDFCIRDYALKHKNAFLYGPIDIQ